MNVTILLQPFRNMFNKARSITLSYVSDVCDRAATRPLGQYLIQKTEDLIWTLERSIEWTLPTEVKAAPETADTKVESNGQQEKADTAKPLPWVLFIPVLMMWRCASFVYETAVSLVGRTPIRPADVVHFLRNQRKNLTDIRIQGKRTMTSQEKSPTSISKLRSFIQQVLSRAVCFAGSDVHKEEVKTCLEVTADSEPDKKEQEQTQTDKMVQLSGEKDNTENNPEQKPAEPSESPRMPSLINSGITEQKHEDTGITRPSFIGGDVIKEEDESSEQDSQKPVEENQKPMEENQKPVEESQKPGEESQKPVEENQKPVEESQKPVEESQMPVEESQKPVEESRKPVEENQKPVKESQKLVEYSSQIQTKQTSNKNASSNSTMTL